VIDGKLDDEIWKQAAVLKDFIKMSYLFRRSV
jgi:hypothetical protein